MKIQKQAPAQAHAEQSADMEQINALAKKTLAPQEVYTFCVRLCDNEVDRDGERFPEATLAQLAPMFVGKSGIFDHCWSAKEQTARIYHTELCREEGRLTAAGDGYCYLKGKAYLLRTAKNAELIEEIEAGIKKEVSVGCSVRQAVCSVCGAESGSCEHIPGKVYDGETLLSGAVRRGRRLRMVFRSGTGAEKRRRDEAFYAGGQALEGFFARGGTGGRSCAAGKAGGRGCAGPELFARPAEGSATPVLRGRAGGGRQNFCRSAGKTRRTGAAGAAARLAGKRRMRGVFTPAAL